jgi:hypothetical protein
VIARVLRLVAAVLFWVSFKVFLGYARVLSSLRAELLCDFLSIPPLYIDSTGCSLAVRIVLGKTILLIKRLN